MQMWPSPEIPQDTAQAVDEKLADRSNPYLFVGDHLFEILKRVNDHEFEFHTEAPKGFGKFLAVLNCFQYREGIPDSKVMETIQSRIDWRYALHLPTNNLSFNPKLLCRFRLHVKTNIRAQTAFDVLLDNLHKIKFINELEPGNSNAMFVVNKVCMYTRIAEVIEAMFLALEALAAYHPEWLRTVILPHWYERYSRSLLKSISPLSTNNQPEDFSRFMSSDICYLLDAVSKSNEPMIRSLPEILSLKIELHEKFIRLGENMEWRKAGCAFCQEVSIDNNTNDPHIPTQSSKSSV